MTALPLAVRAQVEAALEARTGRAARIASARPVGGGCINPSARVETELGEAFFLKWNASAAAGMFEAEADGLRALAQAGPGCGLRIPEVLEVGGDTNDGGWLLLEYVPRGAQGGGWGGALGSALAALHRSGSDRRWGWERDNFIGSLPQANAAAHDWGTFWRERRLQPQLERARAQGHFRGVEGRLFDRLLERVPEALAGAGEEGPSLLHGDLWSGNVYPGPSGEPVLVDPAVYRGHREVDLAMSELFGGFPVGYLAAYAEAWPIAGAYRRFRRALYQLYYLLVHVNLFGDGYLAGTLRTAREALAEL